MERREHCAGQVQFLPEAQARRGAQWILRTQRGRFRPVKPDGGGIVGVSGEEQAVGTIEKADGVGRVTRRGENLDGAPAEIDGIAVVDVFADRPWPGAIGLCVKISRKVTADFAGSDLRLGVRSGTLGIRTAEVRVHGIDRGNCQLPPTWSS